MLFTIPIVTGVPSSHFVSPDKSNANKPYATSTSSCYLLSLLKQTSSSVVHLACYYLPFGTPSSDKHVFNHAGTE